MSFDAGSISGQLALDLNPYFSALGAAEGGAASFDQAASHSLTDPFKSFGAAADGAARQVTGDFAAIGGAANSVYSNLGGMLSGLEEIGTAADSAGGEIWSGLISPMEYLAKAGGQAQAGVQQASGAIGQTGAAATGATAALGETAGSLLTAGAAGGVASAALEAVAGAAKEAVVGLADLIDHLGRSEGEMAITAEKAGVTVEYMSRMSAVAQDAGVGAEALGTGMRFLQRNAADAVEGVEANAKAFNELGISTDFLKSHLGDTQAVFEAVHAALQRLPNQAERTKAEMQLLGRGGAELGPIFNLSAAQLKSFGDTAQDLGVVVDAEAAANGRSYIAMSAQFHQAIEGIERAATEPIFEYLSAHSEEIKAVMLDVSQVIRDVLPNAITIAKDAFQLILPVLELFLQTLSSILEAATSVSDALGFTHGAADKVRDAGDRATNLANDAAYGQGKGSVTIQNLNVGFNADEASTQVANKIHPHLKAALSQQTEAFKTAAHREVVTKAMGGRR